MNQVGTRLVPVPQPLKVLAAQALHATTSPPAAVLSELLPEGLTPGRTWPVADDLVGIGMSSESWLIVTGTKVVGGCGVKQPPSHGRVEVGYGLAPAWRGQGIGREAIAALLDLLAQRPEVSIVCAQVHVDNVPSVRLLAGLGFVPADGPPAEGHQWWERRLAAGGRTARSRASQTQMR